MNNNDLDERRALRIAELQDELRRAKEIIRELLWPLTVTPEQDGRFRRMAGEFVGVTWGISVANAGATDYVEFKHEQLDGDSARTKSGAQEAPPENHT